MSLGVNRLNDRAQKSTISSSYNAIAQKYHDWASPRPTTDRADYIDRLSHILPKDAKILELGCGSGVPATQQCVKLGYDVTGVDVSSKLIEIARREVPGATFHVSDMISFTPPNGERFDCIMAFYTIWHLPPDEEELILRKAATEWLKPGGWLLFNLMTVKGELKMDEWMGQTMISWGLGEDGNRELVKKLVDEGLIEPESKDGTGSQGEIKVEKVGRFDEGMHWFLLQSKA
ncbi:S-adenosyl-L-methionine-dependent methyltransferase [Kockovaella imperatae]|uniref:S-adenosyl-L-methionine-dependent methyltransferase n=1 Tax=Kockovaella imperatae TaxID=4999 RepID=A0A1Y1URC8_9TREE|nr:S-adenosyl-L-methionine-dependent methyltransferase [Kockovaella imperatae]ORX39695.1 S-adenosyl-L-methionine-dependent methyltransferase [Kockovaella imperatae]